MKININHLDKYTNDKSTKIKPKIKRIKDDSNKNVNPNINKNDKDRFKSR